MAHDHPFIIQLHAAFEDAHCYHFVLEYASNGSLTLWLTKQLSERIAKLVAAEALAALGHLHSLGIVHRDLKPDNVLVRATGHIVLADFGVSKRLRGASSPVTKGACSMVGTPGFIAPEVLLQQWKPSTSCKATSTYTYEPDFYALGVLLHVMLACEEPVQAYTLIDLLTKPGGDDGGVGASAGEPCAIDALTAKRVSGELSSAARSLVLALLTFHPRQRLGAMGGVTEVQAHPFFASIDWERLVRLELHPPLHGLEHSLK